MHYRRRVIIIEEERVVPTVQRRQDLYRRLDAAQEAARVRADYIANCPCNPANGGNGLCMCVPPGADVQYVWCGDGTPTVTSTSLQGLGLSLPVQG